MPDKPEKKRAMLTKPSAKASGGDQSEPAAKAKPPAPWRREGAGTHRSSDDRFSIVSEGSGRWFLRDDQELDELGQPRTTGPYPTLADAKAAADRQRQLGPARSPLAARLAGGGRRAGGRAAGRETGKRASTTTAAKPARQREKAAPSWLERLADTDAGAAPRARALVGALERIGVDDAEAVVRRDVEGLRPAAAEAVLAVAIRRELARVTDPARLLEAILRVVSMQERLGDDDRLPGWRLVETGDQGRRLHVTSADVMADGGSTRRR
jgi:hypothetical protein